MRSKQEVHLDRWVRESKEEYLRRNRNWTVLMFCVFFFVGAFSPLGAGIKKRTNEMNDKNDINIIEEITSSQYPDDRDQT